MSPANLSFNLCTRERFCRILEVASIGLWGPLQWYSGKAYASRAANLGSVLVFTVELFPGRVIPIP